MPTDTALKNETLVAIPETTAEPATTAVAKAVKEIVVELPAADKAATSAQTETAVTDGTAMCALGTNVVILRTATLA